MSVLLEDKKLCGIITSDLGLDKDGNPTTDPEKATYLVPFGAHKGYGMALINEILASFIGGSLPTLRSRDIPEGEKRTPSFYFQVIHPEAVSGGAFAAGRNQIENVGAVIEDIKNVLSRRSPFKALGKKKLNFNLCFKTNLKNCLNLRYTGFEDRLVFRLELYTLLQALYRTQRSGSSVSSRVAIRHSSIILAHSRNVRSVHEERQKSSARRDRTQTPPPLPTEPEDFLVNWQGAEPI
mgnify:CR=1 FL=1